MSDGAVSVGSVSALSRLAEAIRRGAHISLQTIADLRSMLVAATTRLQERGDECRREIRDLEERLRFADEGDDVSYLERLLEEARAWAGRIRRCQQQLAEARAEFEVVARQVETLAGPHAEQACGFLARRVTDLEAFVALGPAGGGMLGVTPHAVSGRGLALDAAIEQIRGMEDLRPEKWATLSAERRGEVLQGVETLLAYAQDRSNPMPVKMDAGLHAGDRRGRALFGEFDGKALLINPYHADDVRRMVETVAHEGRHVYQHQAILGLVSHSDPHQVALWRDNLRPGNYLDPEHFGQWRYEHQPVEADAFAYGREVRDRVFAVG